MRTRKQLLFLVFPLAACGGGSGDAPPSQSLPPDAAYQAAYERCIAADNEPDAPLKSLFGERLELGVAISDALLDQTGHPGWDLVSQHFSLLTPENAQKIHFLIKPGGPERLAVYEQRVQGLQLHSVMHPLYWVGRDFEKTGADQAVETESSAPIDRETLLDFMRARAYELKNASLTTPKYVDVVNEAFTEPVESEESTFRESLYFTVLQQQLLLEAFRIAHEVFPDSTLIYNDYGLYDRAKRAPVIRHIKAVEAELGIKIVIGEQAHWSLSTPPIKNIESALQDFHDNGLTVHITELDVRTCKHEPEKSPAPASESSAEKPSECEELGQSAIQDLVRERQPERYGELMKVFLTRNPPVPRISFWGVSDNLTYQQNAVKQINAYPLLFDSALQPKPALCAVAASRAYLAE